MSAATIVLPAGLWADGVHHREAEIRPLTGADELFLGEAGALPPARRTTALLGRCLSRLGPWSPPPPGAVRALTLGDREAMLLHLRRITLGEPLACVVRCGAPSCGEKLEIDLAVGDLLTRCQAAAIPPWIEEDFADDLAAPPAADGGQDRAAEDRLGAAEDGAVAGPPDGGATAWRVRFRLPNGEDQETAADLAATDDTAADALLLERCVAWAGPLAPAGPAGRLDAAAQATAPVPTWLARRVAARMAELDPQAETTLRFSCPACGVGGLALFDAGSWLFQELAGRAGDLLREVHLLALHYHWSEADILGLTASRRRLYLGLLAETLGWEGAAP